LGISLATQVQGLRSKCWSNPEAIATVLNFEAGP